MRLLSAFRRIPLWFAFILFLFSLAWWLGIQMQNELGWPLNHAETVDSEDIGRKQGAAHRVKLDERLPWVRVWQEEKLLTFTGSRRDVRDKGGGLYTLEGKSVWLSTLDGKDPRKVNLQIVRPTKIDEKWSRRGARAVWGSLLFLCALWLSKIPKTRWKRLQSKFALQSATFIRQLQARPIGTLFQGMCKAWPLLLVFPALTVTSMYPPLWKDVDAFYQLAHPPSALTILNYPPLYGFLSRIVLFATAAFEAWSGEDRWPRTSFLLQPRFSDAGIEAIVAVQMLLLVFSLIFLVGSTCHTPLFRFLISLVLAAQSFLYIWGNTVGSESLSMILILFCIGFFARILKSEASWKWWAGFWLLLVLTILCRHVNAILAGLLPAAFLFLLILEVPLRWREKTDLLLSARLIAKRFFVAIGVGLAAIVTAQGISRAAAHLVGIEYRSRAGYVFQWRLWAAMPTNPDALNRFQKDLLSRIDDKAIRTVVIQAAKEKAAGKGEAEIFSKLLRKKFDEIDLPPKTAEARTDHLMNELLRAALFPPSPALIESISGSFLRGLRATPADIARQPFHDTQWFFEKGRERRDITISGLWTLSTFAGHQKEDFSRFRGGTYLWLVPVPLWVTLGVTLTLALLLLIWKPQNIASRRNFACICALSAIALLFWLATSAMTFYSPRFLLPVAVLLMGGVAHTLGTIEAIFTRRAETINEQCVSP